MHRLTLCVTGLLLLFGAEALIAQPQFSPRRQDKERFQRLEKFRMMRMIESVEMSEDEAARFTAKHRAHETAMQNLMDERNGALDGLNTGLQDKHPVKELKELSDRILDVDRKIFDERRRFQEEVRTLLPPEKFARFLVFERSFGRQVRNAIEEMHQRDPGDHE